MMARMTPVSLHFSDVPTGWKKIFTDKQQLATGFACSSRTVSPDEQCYRLICTRASKKSSAQLQTQMWCLPPSNGTFSSKQLANQLLPDSVRFLVAKNILEPIQRSQAQMKECVVEFVHQRHPPLHGFPPHSLHGLSGRTHLHIQMLCATCLCTKILFVVNCCHVQRCGRCRRVSFNTKTHSRLASSVASSFENRM